MRFFRQIEQTILTCGIVLQGAVRGMSPWLLLPPLAILAAYPALLMAGLQVPVAFVTAYALGQALQIWLAMHHSAKAFQAFRTRGDKVWLSFAMLLCIIALVLWLQSPAAAVRALYLYLALRLILLLIDLTDGSASLVRNRYPQPEWRPHDAVMTRVMTLRDIAMILLAETVILTGSVPLMLTLLSFWVLLNLLVERVTAHSVFLVRHTSADR